MWDAERSACFSVSFFTEHVVEERMWLSGLAKRENTPDRYVGPTCKFWPSANQTKPENFKRLCGNWRLDRKGLASLCCVVLIRVETWIINFWATEEQRFEDLEKKKHILTLEENLSGGLFVILSFQIFCFHTTVFALGKEKIIFLGGTGREETSEKMTKRRRKVRQELWVAQEINKNNCILNSKILQF